MAGNFRTFTIDQIITRIQQLCDIENDSHISSTELFGIANSAIAETWDLICNCGRGEKYIKNVNFSSVANQRSYSLSGIASDFYRLKQLYVQEGQQGQLRPLIELNPAELQPYVPTPQVATLTMYYLPISPVLTTGQTFDGINGWEEHTIMTGCCAVKFKKEDSYGQFSQRKEELERRIKAMGDVDQGDCPRVTRKRSKRSDPWYMYRNNVSGYIIRGDNIELYYDFGFIP